MESGLLFGKFGAPINFRKQDLVFSVKLHFGLTLYPLSLIPYPLSLIPTP